MDSVLPADPVVFSDTCRRPTASGGRHQRAEFDYIVVWPGADNHPVELGDNWLINKTIR